MVPNCRCVGLVALALAITSAQGKVSFTSQAAKLVEETLLTTAELDFEGNTEGLEAASIWTGQRLHAATAVARGPYLACADQDRRREAVSALHSSLNPSAVRPVSSTRTHGACFMVTCSYPESEALMSERFEWSLFGPFPSALKVAPGLLEHNDCSSSDERLCTIHGDSMRVDSVRGLTVELSPGTLPADDPQAVSFIDELLDDLSSEALDLFSTNFWSDSDLQLAEHFDRPGETLRRREWGRAASVVHELSNSGETSPSDICSFGDLDVHHAAQDILLVSGLDHLLRDGRGVGGASDEESTELRVACFMGLVSFFSSRNEALRVDTWNHKHQHNAAARGNIQSADVTSTPLTDAGLDGTGEVIQIVDSGLNETSCFFVDDDGESVEHGHYFESIGSTNPFFSSSSVSFSKFRAIFDGGDFTFDDSRRKVIQYIDLADHDGTSSEGSSGYTSVNGALFPFISAKNFTLDNDGHGMHVAATAAGSPIDNPATLVECGDGRVMGCAGACIYPSSSESSESRNSSSASYVSDDDDAEYGSPVLDRLCPAFGCEGAVLESQCLSDDVVDTVTEHGGMAQGAKLAVMDIFLDMYSYGDLAGPGMFESSLGAGAKIHSNSWGADKRCDLDALSLVYDDFMVQNPENLLVFSAGNDGYYTDRGGLCTIGAPAIGKNVLAVGSTSSGETRLTISNVKSRTVESDDDTEIGSIDTISVFSSYGPTSDGRIKPEVLAPGDEIYSANGGDGDGYSCSISSYSGTSMSTAVVSGAAAMVRQYFSDASFYAADLKHRTFLCEAGWVCGTFSPSSATVKAMLINSANLMGLGSEPLPARGFGRLHLDAGMPLNGQGAMVLYVQDSSESELESNQVKSIFFDVDADAGLELRATISWTDPAASTLSARQLVNDLNLRVVSPDGTDFYMWSSGELDEVNVNERVIVDASNVTEIGNGTWTVVVESTTLYTSSQKYSLVVTGAISPSSSASTVVSAQTSQDADEDLATGAAPAVTGSSPFLLAAVSSLTVLAAAMIA